MALSDCTECWSTPCQCGHEFKNASPGYKETMTKSVNGFTIKEVFKWLGEKDYLSEDWELLYKEFIEDKK
jgi:hypothetical protein